METTNDTVIEAFFNILHQDAKLAFQLAEKKEVAIIAKIPLDSGWLTGKYDAKSVFTDIRNRWSKHDIETRARLVNRVKEILQQEDNLAQKAISFCLALNTYSSQPEYPTNCDKISNISFRGNLALVSDFRWV